MKLQHSVTATATPRKLEQFRAISGALMAPKAGVSKHWPFDTHVDPTFLTGLIFNSGNSTEIRQKILFPGNYQEFNVKHHIDFVAVSSTLVPEISILDVLWLLISQLIYKPFAGNGSKKEKN